MTTTQNSLTAQDAEMFDALLSPEERQRLSWLLLNSGMPEVTTYLEEILGLNFEELRQTAKHEANEVPRIKTQVARWLATKHESEYVPCKENQEAILDFLTDRNLPVTVKTLETAWYELMAAGKLKEPPPTPRRFPVGQIDPARAAFDEPVITKTPAEMTASEFASAIQSKKYRAKIDGPEVETVIVSGERVELRDFRKRIRRMSSKEYQSFVSDPENRAIVEAL
jgi:hypothetical protein